MSKTLLAAAVALVAASGTRASSEDAAIVAAMALSDTPNYTWTCTISDDAQTYDIEGKTQADGFTWQRQPMPRVIARRLGREAGRDLEAIFKGPLNYVVATENGWRRFGELPKETDWDTEDRWVCVSLPIMRGPDMPADEQDGDPFGLPSAVWMPIVRTQERDDDRVYTNAQFALALPHQELAIIVSSHAEFHVEGNTASGTLTAVGAQLLLVHDGHEYITPVIGAGRFKLWLKDNAVEKYTVELTGVLLVDRKPVYVRQKSTTTLKNIGTTIVDVPSDARRRLL